MKELVVFIVDDSPSNRLTADHAVVNWAKNQKEIPSFAVTLILAEDGKDAIEKFTSMESEGELGKEKLLDDKQMEGRHYLFIMDYNMPDLNGIETAEKIKKLARTSNIPESVHVLGFSDEYPRILEGKDEAARSKVREYFSGYLSKPVLNTKWMTELSQFATTLTWKDAPKTRASKP